MQTEHFNLIPCNQDENFDIHGCDTGAEIYNGYDGESIDLSLSVDTSDLFEVDLYDGEYTQCSLSVQIQFNIDVYDGEYSDVDLYVHHGEQLDISLYDGEYSDLNSLSTQPSFDIYFYDGDVQYTYLNVTQALSCVSYDGESINLVFTQTLPKELNPISYDGEYGNTDGIHSSSALVVKYHDGESGILDDLFKPEPASIVSTNYDGESILDFTLEEDKFYFRIKDGESGELVELHYAKSLNPVGYDGEYAVADINFAPSFNDVNVYDGEITVQDDLYVHHGEELSVEFSDGESLLVAMPINHILYPFTIYEGERFFDDHSEVFRFCETQDDCCTLPSGDLVIFDVRPEDRPYWGKCGPTEDDVFSVTFTNNVRLEPVSVFDGDTSIVTDNLSLDITFHDNGERVEYPIQWDEIFRFCQGYLLPAGDHVNIDFSSVIKTDCEGTFAFDGENVFSGFDTEIGFPVRLYDGENTAVWLDVPEPWKLRVFDGEYSYVVNTVMELNTIGDGEQTSLKVDRRKYTITDGEYAKAISLETSAPSLEWKTPFGCLVNQYVKRTPSGDVDPEFVYNPATYEEYPFFHRLDARCTLDYKYYSNFYIFQFDKEFVEITLNVDYKMYPKISDGESGTTTLNITDTLTLPNLVDIDGETLFVEMILSNEVPMNKIHDGELKEVILE